MLNYKPQINLFEELQNINKENTLKKKLQNDISLTYMAKFDETRKVERIKVFQQIQVLIKRQEFNELRDYLKRQVKNNKTFIKEFDEKIEKKKDKKIDKGQLENSKDRLTFLNHLVTSQANGYNPVKNFMDKFRMHSKLVQERRSVERNQRLKFLKMKEMNKEKSKLMQTADRLNKAKLERDRIRRERAEKERKKQQQSKDGQKKKEHVPIINVVQEILEAKGKTPQEERIESITLKDGDIKENIDFLKSGFYQLPEYNKALIFKFKMNFENIIKEKVIELIDDTGDLLLHFNIRNKELIILNTQIDNKWGKEIKIQKSMQGTKEIKILVRNDYFKLLENDKVISFFLQRKFAKIGYLNINDDIKDFVFKMM